MVEREPQPTTVSIKCNDCSWRHNVKATGNAGVKMAMEYANQVATIHENQFDHKVEITIGS